MKNAKNRGTSIIAQDKTFQEKLQLVKKKSLFIEQVMRSLEAERDRSNFILESFKKSLMLCPTTLAKADSVEELCEWPELSSLKEVDQPMTQEKMEKLWHTVEHWIKNGDVDEDEYVIIDFEKGSFVWHGISLLFFDAAIEIAPVSIDSLKGLHQSLTLRANNHLRGMVYLWNRWDEEWPEWPVQGLLKTVDEDGKSFFVELEHFSMMNLTWTRDDDDRYIQSACKAEDEPNKVAETQEKTRSEEATEGEVKAGEISEPKEWVETINPGMFTLLNRPWQALYSTRF